MTGRPSFASVSGMRGSNVGVPFFLAAAVILTRLPFTSKLLYNMDSVQFALATDHFDVALHQPQPPGFFLYVLLGRLARFFIPDTNTALIAVSITFSVLVVVTLYYLGSEVFGGETGMAASVIALTSPLLWFHGEVALSYMPEAFMSALFALLCYKATKGETGYFRLAAITIGIAGGIRQNTMVFLAPLWLYSMLRLDVKRIAASLLLAGVTVLAWAIPMLSATGGLARFNAAMKAHWLDSGWHGIHLDWIAFNARHVGYFVLFGLGVAAVPLLYSLYMTAKGRARLCGRDDAVFFIVWLSPPVLFHILIFTHPAVPGHSLIYLVGLIVLAGRGLVTCMAKKTILISVAVVNAFVFIFSPAPFTAKGVRGHDRFLSGYINAVRDNFSPSDTEIIGSDRFQLSYRHVMYYLPEYRVFDDVLLTTPDGPRLFWGQYRKTHRARYISISPSTRHVVDFINYGPDELAGLPPGARLIAVPGGDFLVHYNNPEDLRKVGRISRVLSPAMKGGT